MRFIGLLIAAAGAVWVYKDAKKRGYETLAAIGWALGVFFLMIVFLPLYLFAGRKGKRCNEELSYNYENKKEVSGAMKIHVDRGEREEGLIFKKKVFFCTVRLEATDEEQREIKRQKLDKVVFWHSPRIMGATGKEESGEIRVGWLMGKGWTEINERVDIVGNFEEAARECLRTVANNVRAGKDFSGKEVEEL